jgi:membrane-associated HD superfamily phosphohydrolase
MKISSEDFFAIQLKQFCLVLFDQLPSLMSSSLLIAFLFDEVNRLYFLFSNHRLFLLFQLNLPLFKLLHTNLPGTLQGDLFWGSNPKSFNLLSFWFPIKRNLKEI